MPGALTNYSMVYPGVLSENTENAKLQTMLLTIEFSGRLPRHLSERSIPVEISVSIAEEFGCFTMPIIHAMSVDPWCTPPGSPVNNKGFEPSENSILPADDVPIPFLPLPSEFDYTKRKDWAELSQRIEKWLIELDTELPEWSWGRDTFWLTFVAAFPSFPRGTWPMWDPRIPLEGAFIEQWLQDSGSNIRLCQDIMEEMGYTERDTEDLSKIWDAFCRDAALFYPYALIATDSFHYS